jgi:hypothetical protein
MMNTRQPEFRQNRDTVLSSNASERGAISFQGILVLVIVVLAIWILISLVPIVSIPMDLDGKVKDACDEWLSLSAREQNIQSKKITTRKIEKIIGTTLENHIYDKEKLEISFTSNKNMKVHLPYTININVLGFKLTFNRFLDVDQVAYSF